jgi:hypothetical protein
VFHKVIKAFHVHHKDHAMSEVQPLLFEPTFNRAVKVQVGDDRITSDAGLLLLREADHRLGLTESLAQKLHDPR